jgi:hypothetical protein
VLKNNQMGGGGGEREGKGGEGKVVRNARGYRGGGEGQNR